MFSNKRRVMMKTLLTSNRGCGCGKPKPTDVCEPTPKPKISIYQNTNPTSSTTSGEDFNSITISETDTTHHHHHHDNDNNKNSTKNHSTSKPCPKLIDSIAIEKHSNDPYKDFRHSMLQMIFEKEIYSENDLQELLQCFLQLNAPCHHHVIVEAFTEICEETFPKRFDNNGGVAEPCRRNHESR